MIVLWSDKALIIYSLCHYFFCEKRLRKVFKSNQNIIQQIKKFKTWTLNQTKQISRKQIVWWVMSTPKTPYLSCHWQSLLFLSRLPSSWRKAWTNLFERMPTARRISSTGRSGRKNTSWGWRFHLPSTKPSAQRSRLHFWTDWWETQAVCRITGPRRTEITTEITPRHSTMCSKNMDNSPCLLVIKIQLTTR